MNFIVLVDKKPLVCEDCYFLKDISIFCKQDNRYESVNYCVLTSCIEEEKSIDYCPLVEATTVFVPEYGDDESD